MSEFGLGRLAPVIAMGLLAMTAIVIQLSPTPNDGTGTASAQSESVALSADNPQGAAVAQEHPGVAPSRRGRHGDARDHL